MNEMQESACIDANSKTDPTLKQTVKESRKCNKFGDFMSGVRDFKLCKEDIPNEISYVQGPFNLVVVRPERTGKWDQLFLEYEFDE